MDERMVKSKGRSRIQQYMCNKIVRRGFKLWVLAELQNGYSVKFDAYTGKKETLRASGLTFNVVTQLCNKYFHQGYIIYMDNSYTFAALLVHLLEHKTLASGATCRDCQCFPSKLEYSKSEKAK